MTPEGTLLISFCNLAGDDDPPLALLSASGEGTPLVPASTLPGIGGITGLAADERFVYAAAQVPGRLGRPPNNTAYSELLIFDRAALRPHARYRFRLAFDVHSLAVVDGGLVAVSTGTDALVALTLHEGHVVDEHMHWRADPLGSDGDHLHLNALTRHGDALLVSGFGRRDGRTWSTAHRGFVRTVGALDGAPGPVVASDLVHPHSLLVDGPDLLLCESRDRTVRTLRETLCTALPGYTRGLCRHDSAVYVGTSVGRRHSRSRPGRLGNPRDTGDPSGECTIVALDPATWQPTWQTTLTWLAREVYDLLILDPPPSPCPGHWRAT
ncbi:DUF4915 domain-containing protein [Streptomyces sp. NPDC006739]|uniref:DUF4915 domain-containing protein n=1 Tax=Streptomyces sp. NPDC006739 TaxID=3364763 RepID=UPI00369819B3